MAASKITLRDLPPEVLRKIRERAVRRRISLDRAVVELPEEKLGLRTRRSRPTRRHDIDKFFAMWSRKEADTVEAAIAELRRIEPELWK